MSQYIRVRALGDVTANLSQDEVYKLTAEQAMNDATQRSTNIALGIKGLNQALKATTGKTAEETSKLQAIANGVDNLRVRMQTYLNSLSDKNILLNMSAGELIITALAPFMAIKQIWADDKINKNGHLILMQMIAFQNELQKYCDAFKNLTGSSVGACQMFPPPKPPPSPPGITDKALSFGWSLLLMGSIGLGVWYLYNHLDKYPEDRLPRYAGGRRSSSRKRR